MIAALAIAASLLNPAVRQETLASTICRPGYTRTIRPPSAYIARIKRQLLAGRQDPRGYVVDHEEPLELGGAPRWPNLRLQTKAEAREKDVLENALHRAVCRGTVPLAVAQAEILRRWP